MLFRCARFNDLDPLVYADGDIFETEVGPNETPIQGHMSSVAIASTIVKIAIGDGMETSPACISVRLVITY